MFDLWPENAGAAAHLPGMRYFIMDETGHLVESDPAFLITNGSGPVPAGDESRDVAIVFALAKNGRAAPVDAAPKREQRCATCGK